MTSRPIIFSAPAKLSDVVAFLRTAMVERHEAAQRVREDTDDQQARNDYAEANDHVSNLLIAHQHMLTDVAQAVAESDQDVSPCGFCNKPILCIPDGLPCCEACAKAEASRSVTP